MYKKHSQLLPFVRSAFDSKSFLGCQCFFNGLLSGFGGCDVDHMLVSFVVFSLTSSANLDVVEPILKWGCNYHKASLKEIDSDAMLVCGNN